MKIDAAVPSNDGTSDHATSGNPMDGRPPDTGPMVLTPSSARSSHHEKKIAPITAISAPGTLVVTNRAPRITTMTAPETATVVQLTSPRLPRVETNLPTVLSKSTPPIVTPEPSGTPNSAPICPAATWMPTPVRKPTSTERDRKSARKPSRATRARKRKAAAISASNPARATYWSEPVTASPASPAAMTAAVAESAPTTRWRDEPKTAKTRTGNRIV